MRRLVPRSWSFQQIKWRTTAATATSEALKNTNKKLKQIKVKTVPVLVLSWANQRLTVASGMTVVSISISARKRIFPSKCRTHPLKASLVIVFSVVFPVTKLCCWPVTPALLCRPSCSFSSPLPQYDSRWLTVIGHSSLSPPLPCLCYFLFPVTSHPPLLSLFIHNICVCSPHTWTVLLHPWHEVVWIFGLVSSPFIWRKSLWVSNWSEWVCAAKTWQNVTL